MKRRNVTKAAQERAVLQPASNKSQNTKEISSNNNNAKDNYDNGKSKTRSSNYITPPRSSSSNTGAMLLLIIPLTIFVGIPLIIFGWYMTTSASMPQMNRETTFAIVGTLIIGGIIALGSYLLNNGLLSLLRRKFFQSNPLLSPENQESITDHYHNDDNDMILKNKEEEEWIQPKVRIWKGGSNEEEDINNWIVNQQQRQALAKQVLPRTLADHYWRRLYSLTRDGDTFEAFWRALQDQPRTLLVLKTSHGHVLGGFADVAWNSTTRGAVKSDEGGSGACVFWFRKNSHDDKDDNNNLHVYKWTGANRYTQLVDVERQRIAMGAGDHLIDSSSNSNNFGYAWSAERNFTLGTTAKCPTFDNEPLCEQERFDIVDFDIYGFLVTDG